MKLFYAKNQYDEKVPDRFTPVLTGHTACCEDMRHMVEAKTWISKPWENDCEEAPYMGMHVYIKNGVIVPDVFVTVNHRNFKVRVCPSCGAPITVEEQKNYIQDTDDIEPGAISKVKAA